MQTLEMRELASLWIRLALGKGENYLKIKEKIKNVKRSLYNLGFEFRKQKMG